MFYGRQFSVSIISVAILGIISGCATKLDQRSETHTPSTLTTTPRPVVVARVISQKADRQTRLPSDLVAYRDIAIYPKISGFIDWIGVDRGSLVKKGQLLVRMTAPELPAQTRQGVDAATAAKDESTQANEEYEVKKQELAAAQAKARASADTYLRLKGAADSPGIIAGNDLEVAQQTAEADAAVVRSLEKKCQSLVMQGEAASNRHRAAVQAAQSTRAVETYLRLTAPFDGVITERNVHEGSFVSPPTSTTSQPLLRLKQLTLLRLLVPVPEADVAGISAGATIQFTVSAYPGEYFHGIVRRIADSIDINTRTMIVELDVTNPSRRLSPGMFAEVLWPVRRDHPTLFVPQSAVVKTTEKTFVIRVKDDLAQWIDVKTGISADDTTEVFGDLAGGDQVVLRASDELRSGTQVRPTSGP
jgi:membrane fusion protein, multidrug efflux system